MEIAYTILLAVFGAIIGSFLNVIIFRWPRGRNIGGRSVCPHCAHTLRPLDLIPVVSYVFLRGLCRYCSKRISPRYWIIELITAGLFVVVGIMLLPTNFLTGLLLLKALIFTAVLVTVFVIDLEHYLILDRIIWPATAGIIILNIVLDILSTESFGLAGSFALRGVLGGVLGAAPFFLIWLFSRGAWMGFGDVKLMLLLGNMLGLPGVFVAMFLAFLLGAIISSGLLLAGKKHMSSQVPFGTFLSVAALVTLLWGNSILNYYLALIGL